MRYDLGSLRLQPDAIDLLREFQGHRRRGGENRSLVEVLSSLASGSTALHGRRRDLLDELRGDPGPDEWVFELHDALARRAGLRLTHCERVPGHDGYLAVAVVETAMAFRVREGDVHCPGLAAVRTADQQVEILPRVFRPVCTNGAVVFERAGGDVLSRIGSVGAAVDEALAPETTAAVFECLSAAAEQHAVDPIALLRGTGLPFDAEQVWAQREEFDPTVFGVVNALTARARREPRFDRRLAIERGAARILAGLAASRLELPGATPAGA